MANNKKLINFYENIQDSHSSTRLAGQALNSVLRYYGLHEFFEDTHTDFRHQENFAANSIQFHLRGRNIGFWYTRSYSMNSTIDNNAITEHIEKAIYQTLVQKIEESEYFQNKLLKKEREIDKDTIVKELREQNGEIKTLLMLKEKELEVLREHIEKMGRKPKSNRGR